MFMGVTFPLKNVFKLASTGFYMDELSLQEENKHFPLVINLWLSGP